MAYWCRLKPKKSTPVIVVFSFGTELDFVLRFGRIISVGENNKSKKNPLESFMPLTEQYGKYLLV